MQHPLSFRDFTIEIYKRIGKDAEYEGKPVTLAQIEKMNIGELGKILWVGYSVKGE